MPLVVPLCCASAAAAGGAPGAVGLLPPPLPASTCAPASQPPLSVAVSGTEPWMWLRSACSMLRGRLLPPVHGGCEPWGICCEAPCSLLLLLGDVPQPWLPLHMSCLLAGSLPKPAVHLIDLSRTWHRACSAYAVAKIPYIYDCSVSALLTGGRILGHGQLFCAAAVPTVVALGTCSMLL